jgi:hypothetical protein
VWQLEVFPESFAHSTSMEKKIQFCKKFIVGLVVKGGGGGRRRVWNFVNVNFELN